MHEMNINYMCIIIFYFTNYFYFRLKNDSNVENIHQIAIVSSFTLTITNLLLVSYKKYGYKKFKLSLHSASRFPLKISKPTWNNDLLRETKDTSGYFYLRKQYR